MFKALGCVVAVFYFYGREVTLVTVAVKRK